MRIAALDYGASNGIAIADVHKDITITNMEILTLEKYVLVTAVDDPLYWIRFSRSNTVILEDYPRNAPNEWFIKLHIGLQNLGYVENANFLQKKLVLVAPAQWKPLAKARPLDLDPWEPETQHEKDAMRILWYYLMFLRPGNPRAVRYV